MLNEIHLRRRSTPDEMVDSYFADVIEIASKRRLKFNKKQKPLFEQEFYFDEKDLVFFCRYQNETEIFSKPIQVCLGGYSEKELDEFLTVKSILYQITTESHVHVHDSQRLLKINEVIPLVKLGMIVKAVINQNRMHLIWGEQLNSKIRKWFYGNEQEKELRNRTASTASASKGNKQSGAEDELDILNADEEQKTSRSFLARQAFNNWFHNRFTDSALLKQTSLIEAYAFAISKTVAK